MRKQTLLWANATPETAEAAAKNRWYLLGQYRVLAYGNRAGGILQKADDAVAASLSDEERTWLATAIYEAAEARTNWQEISDRQKQFMQTFENELEAERRRTEYGDEKAHSPAAEAAGAESAGVFGLGGMVQNAGG